MAFLRRLGNLGAAAGLLLAFFGAAGAQSKSVSLSGRILDQNSAAIPGARIIALASGRTAAVTMSDKKGEFSLLLDAGEYTLTVVAEGFAENSKQVRVGETGSPSEEIVLQVAGSTATVTITDMGGYQTSFTSSATKTLTPLRDLPESVTVVSREVIKDQSMQSIGDVVRYVPGITAIQGENNRDQVVIRGNSSSADFFVDGVRDDVQYYRDLYNLDQLEALKGPNAMIFGRGGGGGVINRVTKQAGFASQREFTFQGGSYGNKRVLGDVNHPLNDTVAFRLNGLYENSNSFRDHVNLERMAVNPTFTIAAGKQTQIRLGYEHFRDYRTADRGIPSFQGRPSDVPISTFFGDPDQSRVSAKVNVISGGVDHHAGNLNIRNRTLFGDYDRYYQNFVPGAVSADKARVNISAYNNATHRRNLFNQTDLIQIFRTGSVRHTVLAGFEFGHQVSDNLRKTGFFNNTLTTISVPLDNPTTSIPMTFRQNATDADNHVVANIAAAYAQDQIELSRRIQLLAGIRFDRFSVRLLNNRNGDRFKRIDNLVSPRLGLVVKPLPALSFYTSYSISYLPSSGDQFSSLTSITQTLKPEKFSNYEVGAKWDVRRTLS
ncbi:MAG: TonB-dependent receptor domain-containing protein, partial [Pyrinomonadaceae bacterium]